MQKIKSFLSKHLWLVIILLSIPAVGYLFTKGFIGVSDDLHIAWLYEMDRAIRMGQFPPRFVPDLSFGFGYPLFNFVYPLPFYIGELFYLLGLSLVDSVKAVFILSVPLSMYTMYKLLKEYLSSELSLAGAVLYVYAPYRATEMYVRGTVGEIVAFIFLPLIILSFIKITQNETNNKWIGIGALGLAFLVLSHNIMAYMFMPFAIIFLIARIIWLVRDRKKALLGTSATIILGLAVSVYFWLPAIIESRLMRYSTVFSFYDHFPTLKQLITPYFGYGASVPGPYDLMSFYVGIVSLSVVGLGIILFLLRRKKFTKEEVIFVLWGAIVFFGSVFMMNHRSAFLWESLPLLPYFQFPWRFLAMITFISPLFLIAFSKFKLQKVLALVIIFFAVVVNFTYFKPSEFLGRQDDYYLNRYIPTPTASIEYKTTSEEYLRLPLATQERPDKNYPLIYGAEGCVKSFNELKPLNVEFKTDCTKETEILVSKYYFPGWVAKIDGKETEITIGKPFGQIALTVPAGVHQVNVYYRESKMRLVFDYVSLGALLGALYLIIKKQ